MSSIADRNRDLLIQRIQNDPRVAGDTVLAATALMRVSIFMMMGSGVIGLVAAQLILGEGMIQFVTGMTLGYLIYFGYLAKTMGQPRVLGVMAVLTDKKIVLLGSRKTGVVGEWPVAEIESLDLVRKGNLLVMGKLALTPIGDDRMTFFTSNRRLGREFVERFHELRRRGA